MLTSQLPCMNQYKTTLEIMHHSISLRSNKIWHFVNFAHGSAKEIPTAAIRIKAFLAAAGLGPKNDGLFSSSPPVVYMPIIEKNMRQDQQLRQAYYKSDTLIQKRAVLKHEEYNTVLHWEAQKTATTCYQIRNPICDIYKFPRDPELQRRRRTPTGAAEHWDEPRNGLVQLNDGTESRRYRWDEVPPPGEGETVCRIHCRDRSHNRQSQRIS